MSEQKAVATVHKDTIRLEKFLETQPVGTVVTFEKIAEVAERAIDATRGVLRTARERLRRRGIVYGSVMNIGIRRLGDVEMIYEGKRYVKAASRKATKSIQTLAGADYEKLPNDIRVEHNVTMAQAAMIRQAMKPATTKQIAERIASKVTEAEAVKALSGIL